MKPKHVITNQWASSELTLPRWVMKWLIKAKWMKLLSPARVRFTYVTLLAFIRTCSFLVFFFIFVFITMKLRPISLKDFPDDVGSFLKSELSGWRYNWTYSLMIEDWKLEVCNATTTGEIIRCHIKNCKLLMSASWFACKDWFQQRTRTAGVFQRR